MPKVVKYLKCLKLKKKNFPNFRHFLILGILGTLSTCSICYAASVRASIKEGNSLYRQGKFDEALKYYNEAKVDMPNSDIVNFNIGTALYQKGDYEKAIEAFTKTLLSDNPEIEEKAAYNIGNSKYRLGRLKVNTDLASTVNLYREALDYYKRAIELNQNNTNAKYNHEFVEKELKVLLDKLKQQSSSTKTSEDKQKQTQQDSQQKEGQEQGQQQTQASTSEQEEKEGEQKQQAATQGEEKKKGEEEKKAQEEDVKGYQTEQGVQEEMSEEEARMILDRYDQQGQLLGNMNRSQRGRSYPRVLKDW